MGSQARRWSVSPWLRDVAALALLFVGSLAACGFLLRNDLFLYGDHPGQFLRLWAPTHLTHSLLGWNPLWYAGYPELQFYPPGFVLLGWLLHGLTLGQLPVFAHYQLLLFCAYLLPGATVYALLSRVTGLRWIGLLGGALALIFPELWGGATALFVGLVAERLAFGLVPLALLTGWQALHAARPRRWWLLTALALAAIVLMHPFHAIAPILFLATTAVCARRRWSRLRDLALTGLLALALVAFWLLPLIVRSGYAAPMLRADLAQTVEWLFGPNVRPYLIAALLVIPVLAAGQNRVQRRFALSLAVMGAALLALILFDHLVLIQRLQFYLLDPVRFAAEFYLAVLLLSCLGLAYLPFWLSRLLGRVPGTLLAGLILATFLAWVLRPTLALLRDHRDPARFYQQARQEHELDALWQVLASENGRILFTSYYLQLDGVPTALKAATPYFAQRSILGGTFSHWSPVARYLWTGTTDVVLLPGRVELTDDVSLAGRTWQEWTDGEFYDLCRRLNATTIVATWDDVNARTFLDAAPHFWSFYSDETFVLYRVRDLESNLLRIDGVATAKVVHKDVAAVDIEVRDAAAGDRLSIKMTDFPLWQVEIGGRQVAHSPDDLGLMVVTLPPGSYDLSLRYRPGLPERAGAWLSLIAIVLCVTSLVAGARIIRLKPSDPASRP